VVGTLDTKQAAVYVFVQDSQGKWPNSPTFTFPRNSNCKGKVNNGDIAIDRQYGDVIALSGNTIAITGRYCGEIDVYTTSDYSTWALQQTLTTENGDAQNLFVTLAL
jgi:hypothetical protein